MTSSTIGRPLLESDTDDVLVKCAIAGDEAALGIMMRRYRPVMRGCALRILRANSEADDVVQEAFIAAWQKLSTLNDANQLKPWLLRIVRNKSIDRLRVRNVLTLPLSDDLHSVCGSPCEVVENLLQSSALSAALDQLPVNQRQAWLMRQLSGCSYTAIAGELGVPTSTVRGLLSRSRRTLTRELMDWR